jgi:hypothetical protein
MSTHTFLFTYSVSSVHQTDKSIADVIRERIARLDGKNGWKKLDNVETVFKGEIYLVSSLLKNKQEEAERDITNILKTVFDITYPEYKVYVHVALLVDGLEDVIEFSF